MRVLGEARSKAADRGRGIAPSTAVWFFVASCSAQFGARSTKRQARCLRPREPHLWREKRLARRESPERLRGVRKLLGAVLRPSGRSRPIEQLRGLLAKGSAQFGAACPVLAAGVYFGGAGRKPLPHHTERETTIPSSVRPGVAAPEMHDMGGRVIAHNSRRLEAATARW